MNRFLRIKIYNSTETAVEFDNYTDTDWGISAGSARLQKLIMTNELRFGGIYANIFEVTIFGIDDNLKERKIVVSAIEGSNETNLFTGYIQSSKSDITRTYRDITAYDRFDKDRETDIASFWNTYWTGKTSSTLAHLRNALLDYMEIDYDNTLTFINDNLAIENTLTEVTRLSFETIFSSICILQNTCPNINGNGELEYITLGANSFSVEGNLEGVNCSWEDYTTDKITGVGVYDTSDNLMQTIGTSDNLYKIPGNIFLITQSATTLNTVCTNILNGIKDIQYTPCVLNLVISQLYCELGDYFETDYGNSYIFAIDYSGSLLINQRITSSADGPTLSDYVDDFNDEFISATKIASIKKDIDEFKIDYADYKTEVASEFAQTNSEVVLKVNNAHNIVRVRVGVDPDDQTATRFQVDANNMNLTASNIINLLAGNILNLTANNIAIQSTNFSVTKDGDVTMRNFTASGAMNVTQGGRIGAYTVDTNGNLVANYGGYSVTVSTNAIQFQNTSTGKLVRFAYNGVFVGDSQSTTQILNDTKNLNANAINALAMYIVDGNNTYEVLSRKKVHTGMVQGSFSEGVCHLAYSVFGVSSRPSSLVLTACDGGAILLNYMYDQSTSDIVIYGSDSSSWSIQGGGWLEGVTVKMSFVCIES